MRILLRIVRSQSRFESADALDKQDQGRGDDKTDPGDPNGVDIDGTPMPVWEKYTDKNRRSMEFCFDLGMSENENTPAFTEMLDYAADKLWRK